MSVKKNARKYFAEFLGTFMLVFFAAGSAMSVSILDGPSAAIVGGVASGLVLMIVIWTFADISGGHVNPALTTTLVVLGLFPKNLLVGYVLSQLAGSVAAGLLLLLLLGDTADMGANLPNIALGVEPMQAFAIEILLSFVMMLVIMGGVNADDTLVALAPVPIGAIVGIEVMMFGGLAGAAMNPARAFGPYLVYGDWTYFWIYVAGPVVGIASAGWIFEKVLSSSVTGKK